MNPHFCGHWAGKVDAICTAALLLQFNHNQQNLFEQLHSCTFYKMPRLHAEGILLKSLPKGNQGWYTAMPQSIRVGIPPCHSQSWLVYTAMPQSIRVGILTCHRESGLVYCHATVNQGWYTLPCHSQSGLVYCHATVNQGWYTAMPQSIKVGILPCHR